MPLEYNAKFPDHFLNKIYGVIYALYGDIDWSLKWLIPRSAYVNIKEQDAFGSSHTKPWRAAKIRLGQLYTYSNAECRRVAYKAMKIRVNIPRAETTSQLHALGLTIKNQLNYYDEFIIDPIKYVPVAIDPFGEKNDEKCIMQVLRAKVLDNKVVSFDPKDARTIYDPREMSTVFNPDLEQNEQWENIIKSPISEKIDDEVPQENKKQRQPRTTTSVRNVFSHNRRQETNVVDLSKDKDDILSNFENPMEIDNIDVPPVQHKRVVIDTSLKKAKNIHDEFYRNKDKYESQDYRQQHDPFERYFRNANKKEGRDSPPLMT